MISSYVRNRLSEDALKSLDKVQDELAKYGLDLDSEFGGMALAVTGEFNNVPVEVVLPYNDFSGDYVDQLQSEDLAYSVAMADMAFSPKAFAAAFHCEHPDLFSTGEAEKAAQEMKAALDQVAGKVAPKDLNLEPLPQMEMAVVDWLKTSRVLDTTAFYSDYNQDEEINSPPLPVCPTFKMDEYMTFKDIAENPSLLDWDNIEEMTDERYVTKDVMRSVIQAGLEKARENEKVIYQERAEAIAKDVEDTVNKWVSKPGTTFHIGKGFSVEGENVPYMNLKETASIIMPPIREDNTDAYAVAKQIIAFADYIDPVVVTRDLVREARINQTDAENLASLFVRRLDMAANELATRYSLPREGQGQGLNVLAWEWLKNADPARYEYVKANLDARTDPEADQVRCVLPAVTLYDIASNNRPDLVNNFVNSLDDITRGTVLAAVDARSVRELSRMKDNVQAIRARHNTKEDKAQTQNRVLTWADM